MSRKEKWKNWWWYHKTPVLIAIAAAAVVLYAVLPGLLETKPDYSVAVITTNWVPEETLTALRERMEQAADDANGDGTVLTAVMYYGADLSGETEGTENYLEAARLDADLVGKVSLVFLLDNPEGFRTNTVVPVETEIPCDTLPLFDGIPLPKGTVMTVRTDCDSATIYERIKEYR